MSVGCSSLMKEFLEVLNKAKNVRLNLAIFCVALSLLWADDLDHITLESLLKGLLQSLFLLTSIRLVFSAISLVLDIIENLTTYIKNVGKEKKKILLEEKKNQINKEEIRNTFNELDIYQLYIVQELKKQNHVTVKKSAELFSLKNSSIIYTQAVGNTTESVSLTVLAKTLLNEDLWDDFEQLKYNALTRFFNNMQPKDIENFIGFLEKESICTKRPNPLNGSYTYANDRVFSPLSKTVMFSQPQRSYIYDIDPIAKKVIVSLFGSLQAKD